MGFLGRISSVPLGPAVEPTATTEELVASGAIQPGDPGHPATPQILAAEAVIARALANSDEASLVSAAAATRQ